MPRVSAAHEQEVRDRILEAAVARVRREGLPQLDDRRRRPRERAVGRRDLHVLLEQGRAHPARAATRSRHAGSKSSPRGWRRRRRRPSGWRSPSASTSRRSTNTTGRRARSRSSRRGPRPTASPAFARCSPAGANGSSVPARCCCTRASRAASCRPGWTSTPSPAALLALLDGLMLQRIEAGDAYRPAELERRAAAIVDSCCRAGCRAGRALARPSATA